ncbi:hypothetical protein [Paenibacillus amylolyticus]|uniref:hypothetical protein n=1 Tax=Paenibacillus amylolyticus TaxID=1451 RepID=UPI00344BC75C
MFSVQQVSNEESASSPCFFTYLVARFSYIDEAFGMINAGADRERKWKKWHWTAL